ncbi:MAG: hypothetical protein MSC30_06450 [Gaiellaceae bacterium MAG52_C11]|nr:hypothetical protein [Candidatus Gaiellasilicea maunaloa]
MTEFVDELDGGFGWIADDRLHRAAHALAVDGRVWLIDPFEDDGVEERIRDLGEPAGVIQLLDRHGRDSAALATRLGAPVHVVPDSLPGTPFEVLPVASWRRWQEVALWWPERRILVCADVLGTIPFFRAGAEPIGVHPFLRPFPPRRLRGLAPLHVLVGHGPGRHGEGFGAEVDDALAHARRRIPRWLLGFRRALRSES